MLLGDVLHGEDLRDCGDDLTVADVHDPDAGGVAALRRDRRAPASG